MMNTSTVETQPIATQVLRILLVDDHDLVRQGLRSMLEVQPGWTICGEAATGREAIDMAKQLQPDVAVVDIHMPGMDGLQATREILAANPQTEIVVLTIDETKEAVRAAKEVGARGIVMIWEPGFSRTAQESRIFTIRTILPATSPRSRIQRREPSFTTINR